MKKTNLEKIIEAKKMGYSAVYTLRLKGYTKKSMIVAIKGNKFLIDRGIWIEKHKLNLSYLEITDYVYCGELFGKPEIKEGQVFTERKCKGVNIVYIATGIKDDGEIEVGQINVMNEDGGFDNFHLSELTPVFD